MTPTHIMLTGQGFVAMPNNVLFAPEEQEKVRKAAHFKLMGEEEPKGHTWEPENNTPYALPDGVEVEIKGLCDCERSKGGTMCFSCTGKKPFAYLKTKETDR